MEALIRTGPGGHPAPVAPKRPSRLAKVRWWLGGIDWLLVASVVLLCAVGTLAVTSATRSAEAPLGLLPARILHLGIGFGVLVAFASLPYGVWGRLAKGIYGATLLLLVAVDLVGRESLGAQRWLVLGPMSVQPSEFAKLGLIVTLARVAADHPPRRVVDLVRCVLYVVPPTVLVFWQPDFGTSLAFIAILLGVLFAAGAPLRSFMGLAGLGLATAPLVWRWMKPYQQKRLWVFLDPNLDPLGTGYSLIQSKIAIGSGQLWGKGLFGGTQNALEFLPMQHTDFVFAVIGEELGFVGSVGVLICFWVYLTRGLRAAHQAQDPFGSLLCAGIVSLVGFHVLVNVGMTVGLAPVTGIPLPFLSHGGSALITNLAATGILLNVGSRRRNRSQG
jgi:rod shape determining protein RodA